MKPGGQTETAVDRALKLKAEARARNDARNRRRDSDRSRANARPERRDIPDSLIGFPHGGIRNRGELVTQRDAPSTPNPRTAPPDDGLRGPKPRKEPESEGAEAPTSKPDERRDPSCAELKARSLALAEEWNDANTWVRALEGALKSERARRKALEDERNGLSVLPDIDVDLDELLRRRSGKGRGKGGRAATLRELLDRFGDAVEIREYFSQRAEIEAKLEQIAAEEDRLLRELSTARSVEKTVRDMAAENAKDKKRLGCE